MSTHYTPEPGDTDADRLNAALAEIERLQDIITQAFHAMEAMHPDAPTDMSATEYARLWNATAEMLARG